VRISNRNGNTAASVTLGFRTQHEIEQVRYALKPLRGDFHGVGKNGLGRMPNPATQALAAVED
jgi:hypothetical protein